MAPCELRVERRGIVVSGRGYATPLLRGRKELNEYFGEEPHPGSLNILLDWPIQFCSARVKIRIEDYLVAWAGTMEGHPCLFQRWPNCPLHVVEVIWPYHFRLEKGQRARVQFHPVDLAPLPWSKLVGWGALWGLRRRYAYSNDRYYHWAQEIAGRWPAWFGQQPLEAAPVAVATGKMKMKKTVEPSAARLDAAARRIAELERKVRQQQVELDFFRQALRQVKGVRRPSDGLGVTRSKRSSKR